MLLSCMTGVLTSGLTGTLATAPVAPSRGATIVAASGFVSTVWDLAWKGGIVMIPIVLCSLVALAFAIERALSLRASRVIPPTFIDSLRAALAAGPGKALALCREQSSAAARVADSALTRWHRPNDQIEKSLTESGVYEATMMRTRLRTLALITTIAPLLGLLGTIFGMIKAFRTVAENAEALGRTELLASGIYEAMVTTAAGLIVAIPTLLLYHALSAMIERRVLSLDALCRMLLEQHAEGPRARRTVVAEREPERAIDRSIERVVEVDDNATVTA